MGIIRFVDRIKSILWQDDRAIFWDMGMPSISNFVSLADSIRGIDSANSIHPVTKSVKLSDRIREKESISTKKVTPKNISISDHPLGTDFLSSPAIYLNIRDGSQAAP